MLVGMPELKVTNNVCGGYALGKHCKEAFPRKTS